MLFGPAPDVLTSRSSRGAPPSTHTLPRALVSATKPDTPAFPIVGPIEPEGNRGAPDGEVLDRGSDRSPVPDEHENVLLRRIPIAILAAAVMAAGLLTGSASADGTMTISLPAKGKIVSKSQAELRVAVACAPLISQVSGSGSVTLTQSSGSKATKATGSVPINCDGQTREYVVEVVALDGRWHNGEATVSAVGTATGATGPGACYVDSDGNLVCTAPSTPNDSGTAGPATTVLEN